jgi:hypothetical protein
MLRPNHSDDARLPRFDGRTTVEWLVQAERFDRLAEEFRENRQLCESLHLLAAGAREMAWTAPDSVGPKKKDR